MKNPEIHTLWTKTRSEYSDYLCIDNVANWKKILDRLVDYMNVYKKRPSQDSVTDDVKSLATWISNNFKNYNEDISKCKERMKIQEIHKLWSKTISTYNKYLCDSVTNWKNIHNATTEYMTNNNKPPSSADKNKEIRKLGTWISSQKSNYDEDITKSKLIMRTEEIHILWKNTLIEYGYHLSYVTEWKQMLCKVVEFINTKMQRPRNIKDEGCLARWIKKQNDGYETTIEESIGKCMTNPELHKLWSEILDKHSEYLCVDHITEWKNSLGKTIEYMDQNNKPPSSADKNKETKKLGKWISHQKTNYDDDIVNSKSNMKIVEIRQLWTKTLDKYSELLGDNETIWKFKHTKLIEFMNKNNKRPSNKDKNKDIKILGTWLQTQNCNYNIDIAKCDCIMTNLEIHILWTKTRSEYSDYLCIDLVDNWKNKFNKLTDFIKTNNKTPTASSDKVLTNWVCSNKSKYNIDIIKCKESMKNQEIHKIWTDFMEMEKEPKKKNMKLAAPSQNQKPETSNERQIRVKSEISVLHQHYKTLRSDNLRNEFNTNPELWHKYHEISEQNEASFPEEEIPRNRIITELKKIQTKRTKNIIDMGCGKAQISQHFKDDSRFLFTNYDHIAFDESIVTACDISKTPEEDDSVEIVILSLAMWGSNCSSYITEAFRILETNGTLYIMEPTKRWSEMDGYNIKPETAASKLRNLLTDNGFIIVKENIGKFSMFVCIKHKFM
jgi:hypothetical protein